MLVYGAGDAGRQFAIAMENSPELMWSVLDDNNNLHRQALLEKQCILHLN